MVFDFVCCTASLITSHLKLRQSRLKVCFSLRSPNPVSIKKKYDSDNLGLTTEWIR